MSTSNNKDKEFNAWFSGTEGNADVIHIDLTDYLISLIHYTAGSCQINIHGIGRNECQNLISALQSRLAQLIIEEALK